MGAQPISRTTARQEWEAAWPMPMVAMCGIAGTAAFAYSGGIFMEPMIAAFGWSRTQFSAAFVIQTMTGLLMLPIIGRLAHRFGLRKVVLAGIVIFCVCFSLLGTVGGDIADWWLLCVLLTAGIAGISQVVWVSALVGHFRASRGLAISLALAGLGVGSVIWPPLALIAIRAFGWRLAFAALAVP
jgi:MFS family permease